MPLTAEMIFNLLLPFCIVLYVCIRVCVWYMCVCVCVCVCVRHRHTYTQRETDGQKQILCVRIHICVCIRRIWTEHIQARYH